MAGPSLLVHGGTVLTMDDVGSVQSPGYVMVRGERIAAVEAGDPPLELLLGATRVIDARGQIVLPGLINAHTHLYQTFLKGRDDTLSLVDWCEEVLFPSADVLHTMHWDEDDESAGYSYALLGALEMIRGGITCALDMDIVMDSVFEAWQEIGLRGIGALTLSDQWLPQRLRRDENLLRQETVARVRRWHGTPVDSPLTHVVLAPSTPFLASRQLLEWTLDQARELGLGVQMHVAETRWEVQTIEKETGQRPVAYLDSLGLLNDAFSAVHCVHVTADEIETLRERDVTVVHSPKSNLKLGSGIAPVQDMLSADIPVALGTDGAASNDLLDMFEEMRFAALLPKGIAEDPRVISAPQALRMATVNGARAFGIEAGVLAPGFLADLITVSVDRPHNAPALDPYCALVYCARADDVQNVVINGRMVMQGRMILTVSEEDVLAEAISMAKMVHRRSLDSELRR